MSEQPLDPVLDFLRLLWGIEHGLQRTSKRMASTLGITGPQRLVLRVVSESPGMSAGEVARIARLHPSTITGILQRLVRKRLLIRTQDPRDSRRVLLRVPERARPLARRSSGTVEHAVRQAFRRISRQQVSQARAVLAAVAAELDREPGGRKLIR